MGKGKSIADFTMKDWRNLGIYLVVLGLFAMFVGGEWKIGFGLFIVGIIFTAIFQGPKMLKILRKEHW